MASDTKTVEMLQAHLAKEATAAHFYMRGANWCNFNGYEGAADFCHAGAEGEWKDFWTIDHVIRDIFNADPVIPPVPEIAYDYKTLQQFVQKVLDLEQTVTESLEALHANARPMIQMALEELLEAQLATEGHLMGYLRLLANAGDDAAAIFQVDRHMAKADGR